MLHCGTVSLDFRGTGAGGSAGLGLPINGAGTGQSAHELSSRAEINANGVGVQHRRLRVFNHNGDQF